MSFSFDNIRQTPTSGDNGVSYFALKNDRDSAVVRFMHDTVESFDVVDLHEVDAGGKRRKVACLCKSGESVENCPFCAAGLPLKQRMYIHLLQYEVDASGKVIAVPRVWDRPVSYAYKMRDFINNYGPLSDMLFTIVRNGAAGDTSTTYNEMPAMPNRYPPENYPKVEAFENYSARGTVVAERSAADMQTYLETGNFPIPNRNSGSQTGTTPTSGFVPPATNYNAFNPAPQQSAPRNFNESVGVPAAPTTQAPQPPQNASTPQNIQRPWETNAQPTAQRPVRYF